MKKLSSKTVKGLLIASGVLTAGVCTLAIKNNTLEADDLLVDNDVMEVKKANVLEEAENQVKEANAKALEADQEFAKATAEEEKAEAEVKKATEAYEKAESAKKAAEAEVKAAKTEAERKAAEEKVKAVQEEFKKAESTKKEAETKAQTAKENVKNAESVKEEALNNVKKAEDNRKLVEEQVKKEAETTTNKENVEEPKQQAVEEIKEEVKQEPKTTKKTTSSTTEKQTTQPKSSTKQATPTVTEAETNSSRGLTDEQYQRIQEALERDAKTRAEEKALADARNEANSSITATEKALKDLGDKVSKDDKKKAEDEVAELKKALEGNDIDDIKTKTEALNITANDLDAKVKQEAARKEAERKAWEEDIKKQSDVVNGHDTYDRLFDFTGTPSVTEVIQELSEAQRKVTSTSDKIESENTTINVNKPSDVKNGQIWFIEFKVDLSKAEAFPGYMKAGNDAVILEGRRSDYEKPITVTAPTAKAGYQFVGWRKYTVKYTNSENQSTTFDGYEAVYESI